MTDRPLTVYYAREPHTICHFRPSKIRARNLCNAIDSGINLASRVGEILVWTFAACQFCLLVRCASEFQKLSSLSGENGFFLLPMARVAGMVNGDVGGA
jgi:hypothetical protein